MGGLLLRCTLSVVALPGESEGKSESCTLHCSKPLYLASGLNIALQQASVSGQRAVHCTAASLCIWPAGRAVHCIAASLCIWPAGRAVHCIAASLCIWPAGCTLHFSKPLYLASGLYIALQQASVSGQWAVHCTSASLCIWPAGRAVHCIAASLCIWPAGCTLHCSKPLYLASGLYIALQQASVSEQGAELHTALQQASVSGQRTELYILLQQASVPDQGAELYIALQQASVSGQGAGRKGPETPTQVCFGPDSGSDARGSSSPAPRIRAELLTGGLVPFLHWRWFRLLALPSVHYIGLTSGVSLALYHGPVVVEYCFSVVFFSQRDQAARFTLLTSHWWRRVRSGRPTL